ncbi:MAG: ABC transporter permease [Muribaculaceae bacterium]|nr:ABC transporter permease [Muribaculaceae bacterium]
MNLGFWISRHLKLSGQGRGPSRSGVVIAVCGIAVATAVMLLSIAVVAGFKDGIISKVAGFIPSLTVSPVDGYRQAVIGPDGAVCVDAARADSLQKLVVERLMSQALPAGARPSAVYRRPGIIKTENDFMGVEFVAFSENHNSEFEAGGIIDGHLPAAPDEIAISALQADRLGLRCGDKVYVYFVAGEAVRTRRPRIAGIFRSDFGDYDKSLAYITPALAATLRGVGVDAYEVRGLDDASTVAATLQPLLVDAYGNHLIADPWSVETVGQRAAAYFNWLDLLDTNVIVILILMGFVSGFTLISSLIILILERVRMIGVLKSLGATDSQVRGVFVMLGVRIVAMGLAIGNAVALGLIFAQRAWHFIPLDPSAYYLDHVAVDIRLWQVAALDAGVVAAAMALMLLPAMIVARISPSSVMRYE